MFWIHIIWNCTKTPLRWLGGHDYLLWHLSAGAVIWRLQASQKSCVTGLASNLCPSPFSALTRGSVPWGKMDQASLRWGSGRASLTTPVLPCVTRSSRRPLLSPGTCTAEETLRCLLSPLQVSRLPCGASRCRCAPLCPFVTDPLRMSLTPEVLSEVALRPPVLRLESQWT